MELVVLFQSRSRGIGLLFYWIDHLVVEGVQERGVLRSRFSDCSSTTDSQSAVVSHSSMTLCVPGRMRPRVMLRANDQQFALDCLRNVHFLKLMSVGDPTPQQ